MDYFKTLESFVIVSSLGSFSAAAEQLGVSRALVTRHISDLETRLGARLVNRTTRQLRLTSTGMAYLDSCKQILADINRAEAFVKREQTEPEGALHIAAPKSFGAGHFASAIMEFCRRHPKIRISLWLDDDATHGVLIGRKDCDVGIRLAPLAEKSAAVARRIGELKWVTCASPRFLDTFGEPQSPADLKRFNCLVHTSMVRDGTWRFGAAHRPVKVAGAFTSNSALVLRQAALEDIGIVQMPYYHVAGDLAAGRLVQILKRYPPPARPIYAMLPANRHVPRRVQVFLAFISAWCKQADWRALSEESVRPGQG